MPLVSSEVTDITSATASQLHSSASPEAFNLSAAGVSIASFCSVMKVSAELTILSTCEVPVATTQIPVSSFGQLAGAEMSKTPRSDSKTKS